MSPWSDSTLDSPDAVKTLASRGHEAFYPWIICFGLERNFSGRINRKVENNVVFFNKIIQFYF
jgi:hypothetical protein